MVKEISDNKQPFVDFYGRVTFFYVVLGGQMLPVYQPGTIMFETAVKEDSEVSIVHNGV